MFTGLVQDIGTVESAARGPMTRLAFRTGLPAEGFSHGESIAIDGACLTVVATGRGVFEVEASPETLRCTTLSRAERGTRVNLERALRMGDALGGHLVLGHVDARAPIVDRWPEAGSLVLGVELPAALEGFFIEKGSVCVDGVSLTVNRLGDKAFFVQLIPATRAKTTLGDKRVGDLVNLEADVLGKYVARLLAKGHRETPGTGLSLDKLREAGLA
jgi:riboflavin synthase